MKAILTARRLHPGHFEAFRQAWQPERFPPGMVKAYVLRDRNDADQVTAFGVFDLSEERIAEQRVELAPKERERDDRMAAHVAETITSGFFDVTWSMEGRATGDHGLVPMTERRLRPGTSGEFRAALKEYVALIGELPPGLARAMLFANESNPDHLIQLGIVRTDDPRGFTETTRPGRETMLEALSPYIESIGIDTTYDLVEEVSPVHA